MIWPVYNRSLPTFLENFCMIIFKTFSLDIKVNESLSFFTILWACLYIGLVYLTFSRMPLLPSNWEYQCSPMRIGWSAYSAVFLVKTQYLSTHTHHTCRFTSCIFCHLSFLFETVRTRTSENTEKYLLLLFSCFLSSHWQFFWLCSFMWFHILVIIDVPCKVLENDFVLLTNLAVMISITWM